MTLAPRKHQQYPNRASWLDADPSIYTTSGVHLTCTLADESPLAGAGPSKHVRAIVVAMTIDVGNMELLHELPDTRAGEDDMEHANKTLGPATPMVGERLLGSRGLTPF